MHSCWVRLTVKTHTHETLDEKKSNKWRFWLMDKLNLPHKIWKYMKCQRWINLQQRSITFLSHIVFHHHSVHFHQSFQHFVLQTWTTATGRIDRMMNPDFLIWLTNGSCITDVPAERCGNRSENTTVSERFAPQIPRLIVRKMKKWQRKDVRGVLWILHKHCVCMFVFLCVRRSWTHLARCFCSHLFHLCTLLLFKLKHPPTATWDHALK